MDIGVFDLEDDADYRALIETKTNLIQSGINVEQGPILKLGLCTAKDKAYLLIAIHQLVIDDVSWHILLEDFTRLYQQISDDKKIELPLKTASFQKWAGKIHEYSGSGTLAGEVPYWKKISETNIAPLPKDNNALSNSRWEANVLDFRLSTGETSQLLKDVHQAYNTVINDILLSSLGLALAHWSGNKRHALDVEGHGRESIISDIDISRTIGCFTALYPVILDIQDDLDLSHAIKRTKEMLREIPNKGIGYGILAYITNMELKESPFNVHPEIKYTYVSPFDENLKSSPFSIVDMPAGRLQSMNSKRKYHLEIMGMVSDAQLKIEIYYNALEYEKNTIINLMTVYKEYLQKIIEHCVQKKETELTKSDFSSSRIKDEDVANMYEALENIFDSK